MTGSILIVVVLALVVAATSVVDAFSPAAYSAQSVRRVTVVERVSKVFFDQLAMGYE
jgi:hypothetical protein